MNTTEMDYTDERRCKNLSTWISIVLCLSATAVSYHYGKITSYNDATAHLDIARRIFDNINPGLAQLGSVWLPLLHLLLLPLVTNNFLWQSGLAGSIVSGASFILASYFTFRLVYLLTKNGAASVIGSMALCTNLNFLYLQSTPMFEPLLIATVLGAMYYLTRWAYSDSVSDLVLGALWTMLATLTRYDGWAFFIATLILISLFIFAAHRKKREGPLVIFVTLAGFGIVLWLIYNLLIFHDPLYFQRGPYSAAAQQQVLAARGQLPTEHNALGSIQTYAMTVLLNVGVVPVALGLIGIATYIWREHRRPAAWFPLLLLTPLFFNIISLYTGQSVIWLPMLPPDYGTYFNARYGVLMLPATAFFIGYLASRQRWILAVCGVGILLQIALFAFPKLLPIDGDQIGLVTLKDTVSSVNSQTIVASAYLHRNYRGGDVLVSSASSDAFIFRSDLPLKRIISEGSGSIWDESLRDPSASATWLVFFGSHTDAVGKAMGAHPERLNDYKMVYHDSTYQIWVLKSGRA